MYVDSDVVPFRKPLPPEAGEISDYGYKVSESWLKNASPEQQQIALETWFLTRYEDPANKTPYSSGQGGYIYTEGGPYDATETIENEFYDLVDFEIIQKAAEHLQSEGIYEWAPKHSDYGWYDYFFNFEKEERNRPYDFLNERIESVDRFLNLPIQDTDRQHFYQMLFSTLITALEAYLSDTLSYWIFNNEDVKKRFFTSYFSKNSKKIEKKCIFSYLEKIDQDITEALQYQVWHRLDTVVPLLSDSLQIKQIEFSELMSDISIRHDIVHRGGKNSAGEMTEITQEKILSLKEKVKSFTQAIEDEIQKNHPYPPLPLD